MTKDRFTQIGLDRLVRLEWLERVSTLSMEENEPQEIKKALQADMSKLFPSGKTNVRGSLDKSTTILMRIWVTVPKGLENFRNDGLVLLKNVPGNHRIAVHWGMISAVYPFWASVASQVGRLLKLNGTVTTAQVQRRIREQFGERETVARRVRYLVRSLLDWGVIDETEKRGVYTLPPSTTLGEPQLIAWLLEAILLSKQNRSGVLKDLIESPNIFPFRIKQIDSETLSVASSRLDPLREGSDNDLIMLKRGEQGGC